MSACKTALAVLLPLLGAIGCAAPASDEVGTDQGAMEVGASGRSALEAGSYASSSAILIIETKKEDGTPLPHGKVRATFRGVKSSQLLTPVIAGNIDVSVLDGSVTLGEPSRCKVKFDVSKGHVRMTAKADGVCFGQDFDEALVRRTPKDLEGVYACAEIEKKTPGGSSATGSLKLSAATEKGLQAAFTTTNAKALPSESFDAYFLLPATDFVGYTDDEDHNDFLSTSPSSFTWSKRTPYSMTPYVVLECKKK